MKCGKLLAKNLARGHLEIKCLRCGTLNYTLEKMTQQVIITDPDGKILYINKATEDATGYSMYEAIKKKPSNLWGKQMPEKFYKKLWKTIKTDKKAYQISLTNKKKTGELYDVIMTISPIFNTSGSIIFYIGIEMIS